MFSIFKFLQLMKAKCEIDLKVLGKIIFFKFIQFLKAFLGIISTPSGISIYSIAEFSKALSSNSFTLLCNLTFFKYFELEKISLFNIKISSGKVKLSILKNLYHFSSVCIFLISVKLSKFEKVSSSIKLSDLGNFISFIFSNPIKSIFLISLSPSFISILIMLLSKKYFNHFKLHLIFSKNLHCPKIFSFSIISTKLLIFTYFILFFLSTIFSVINLKGKVKLS